MFDLSQQERFFLLSESRNVSFGELSSYSQEIKEIIGERNIIICLSKNNVNYLCGYISMLCTNNVPVLLDDNQNNNSIKEYEDAYKPNYYWVHKESQQFKNLKKVFSIGDFVLFEVSLKKRKIHNDLALLLSTSGSTGSKKLVRLSYSNISSNASSIAKYLDIKKNDISISSLPLHYTYGLSIVHSFLLRDAKFFVTNLNFLQRQFWEIIKINKITHLSGVPYSYEMLKKLNFFDMDLPYLKTLTQAGGKLSNELHKEFHNFCAKKNKRFFVMYGQTEATSRISYLPFEKKLKKLGSIGIPIPGGTLKIYDNKNEEIKKNNKTGEIIYEGKNVALGYAESIDSLKLSDSFKGKLNTGDLGYFDEDNFFYITGRKKRIIKMQGTRLSLDEIESNIQIDQDFAEFSCIGEDDLLIGFTTDYALEGILRKKLVKDFKIPSKCIKLIRVNEIPKTSSGKKSYEDLKKIYISLTADG